MKAEKSQYDLAIEKDRNEALAAATAAKEAMLAAEEEMMEAMHDAWSFMATYEEIGRAVGMTKQAARYRVKKALDGLDSFIAPAELVPVGSKVQTESGDIRPTLVVDKRVGSSNVTFYDKNDKVFLEVPIGTALDYTPVDGAPRSRP